MNFVKTALVLAVVWGCFGCSTWNKHETSEKRATISGPAALADRVLIGRELDKNDRRRYQ